MKEKTVLGLVIGLAALGGALIGSGIQGIIDERAHRKYRETMSKLLDNIQAKVLEWGEADKRKEAHIEKFLKEDLPFVMDEFARDVRKDTILDVWKEVLEHSSLSKEEADKVLQEVEKLLKPVAN